MATPNQIKFHGVMYVKADTNKAWLRIHAGSVKNDKDAKILTRLQTKHKAEFTAHTVRSMYFVLPTEKAALNFYSDIKKHLSYLNVTSGVME